jgi:hypothetical protein
MIMIGASGSGKTNIRMYDEHIQSHLSIYLHVI